MVGIARPLPPIPRPAPTGRTGSSTRSIIAASKTLPLCRRRECRRSRNDKIAFFQSAANRGVAPSLSADRGQGRGEFGRCLSAGRRPGPSVLAPHNDDVGRSEACAFVLGPARRTHVGLKCRHRHRVAAPVSPRLHKPRKGRGFDPANNSRVEDASALPKAGVQAKPERQNCLL